MKGSMKRKKRLMTNEKPVVLVTGASGLIGKGVVDDLAPEYRMVGFDVKEPDSDLAKRVDWIHCDLTDDASTAQAFEELRAGHGDRIASVIHLAAYYDFSAEPSPLYQELTVEGTIRMLRQLNRFELEQFVFSSSLLAMKPVEPGETLTEQSPTQAEWDYPRSKLEAEEAIERERGTIAAVVLRIAGVYDEDCHSLPISQQIRRIYEKELESHFFPGNQEHGQSFVHREDLIRCFRRVVERRKKLDGLQTILVGEPEVVSYGDLQGRFGELIHGKEWTTLRVPKTVAKVGAWVKDKLTEEKAFIQPWMVDLADAHYPVSIDKAESELGWTPRHRLADELAVMVSRLREDPRRWYEENGLPWPGENEEQRSEREEVERSSATRSRYES